MKPSCMGYAAGATRGIGVASSVEAGAAGAAGACAAVAAVAESFAVCARSAGGQIEKHSSTAVPMSRFNLTINLLGMGKRKSAFSPAQLASQNFVVGQARRADKLNFGFGFGDHDAIFGLELKSDLAVEGQEGRLVALGEIEFDARGIGNDQRAVGQHVRTDRSDDESVEGRMDDRAAGGERIGGGTGRRGYDQAVGAVAAHVTAV